MLKILFKVVPVIVIFLSLGIYAEYLRTGQLPDLNIQIPQKPEINVSNITQKMTDSIAEKLDHVKDVKLHDKNQNQMYKWRGENGVIHYTSEKPADNIDYESIRFSGETNVVPAIKQDSSVAASTETSAPEKTAHPSTDIPDNLYSPEGIQQLFDQAENIQNLVNDKFRQQESSINSQ